MVLGIGSIVFSVLGFLPGVAAIVVGLLARQRQPHARSLWMTGIIAGAVGALLSILTTVVLMVTLVVGGSVGWLDQFRECRTLEDALTTECRMPSFDEPTFDSY